MLADLEIMVGDNKERERYVGNIKVPELVHFKTVVHLHQFECESLNKQSAIAQKQSLENIKLLLKVKQ